MTNDLNGIILCIIIILLIFVLGLVLRSGRGANLLNGYNILPERKKALFNEKALCRFYGNLLFVVDIFLIVILIAAMVELIWLIISLTIILFIISIIATIYSYTNVKFRNKI